MDELSSRGANAYLVSQVASQPDEHRLHASLQCVPKGRVSLPKERQDFWCGEGGDHMVRFGRAEQHQSHLLFIMWHDFHQLDSSTQQSCKSEYLKRTYECLSKAGNSTRVVRQLQAFAHFVCGGGDIYIEPSKFVQCDSEVVSQRPLFKRLVQRVMERVEQSEEKHKAAVERASKSKAGTPSARLLKSASKSEALSTVSQTLVVSIQLCEVVAKEVLAEHPLISRVVSAEVHDCLPSYTIAVKGQTVSAESTTYSYDALAIREENIPLLAAYNKKWKQEVAKVGNQVDPATKQRTPTVTWKSDSRVTEVSRRFFDIVDWQDYYALVRSASADEEGMRNNPSTPVRSSAVPARSALPQSLSTPMTPAERTIQRIHDIVNSLALKGMSEHQLQALCNQVLQMSKEGEPSGAAAETSQDSDLEGEDGVEEGDSSSAESDEKEEAPQGGGSGKEEKAVDEEPMSEDEEPEDSDDHTPRITRSAKRKLIPRRKLATVSRTQKRRA